MERKKRICAVGIAYIPPMGDLPNLQTMDAESPSYFEKEFLTFKDKYVFPYLRLIFLYQGLFLREIWDLEIRK